MQVYDAKVELLQATIKLIELEQQHLTQELSFCRQEFVMFRAAAEVLLDATGICVVCDDQ